MIYRRKLRTILNSTETTQKTDSIATDTLAFVLATSDAFYIGWPQKFAARYFAFGTLNTNSISLAVTAWDGTAWTAVDDLIDQTRGFTQNGWVSWKNLSNWTKKALTPVDDEELFWIRVKVSGATSAGTALQAVLNLFCDDVTLAAYFPELIADTRYLPRNRTNFLEQYEAAKNMVVQKLYQAKAIKNEAMVLNPEELAVPAAHAAAYIILNGIPNPDEDLRDRKKDILDNLEFWLSDSVRSLDLDNSGEIEPEEENIEYPIFRARL